MFSTDAGACSERKGLTMVDWSICPVRIAPFQDIHFLRILLIAHRHQILRSICSIIVYSGMLVRCRQLFRFDLCEFSTFQQQCFRLTLAPC